jgi:hypothetical protein
VFENRVLRIFVPKRGERTEDWRKLHNEELKEECDWRGMQHEWGRRRMNIGYLWESQKERDHFEVQDVVWILER